MKFFNVSRWGTVALTVLMGFNLVGCGGGGGGDDDDDDDGGPTPTPAPQQLSGNSVTFYPNSAETRAVTFNDNGIWEENRDGTRTIGSYQYRPADGGSAELILDEEGEDSTIVLTFNSQTTGSYVYQGEASDGTFELRPTNPDPGGGNEPPQNNGLAPSSLAGITLQGTRTFTSTGSVGQTHVYTFSINSFHDSDPPEESDGSYTYEPDGNDAKLTLEYFAPAAFNGDEHELQMTFHTANAGAFESVYTRRDGTVIRINGTFTIE